MNLSQGRGIERGKELKKMSVALGKKNCAFKQSAIDPSVWAIVRGDVAKGKQPSQTGSEGIVPKGAG